MNSCPDCGKDFKFPYLLLSHFDRVTSCSPNKVSVENLEKAKENDGKVCSEKNKICIENSKVCQEISKVCDDNKKVDETKPEKIFQCSKCEKTLTSNQSLKYHSKICKGVHSLQCPTCLKSFSNKTGKYKHIKFVKCSPPEKKIDLEEEYRLLKKEIESLKKEISILKATRCSHTTNNNTTNNNNTKNINAKNIITNNCYIIKYNPKTNNYIIKPNTRCITSNDPDEPFPELIDQDALALQTHIDNVRRSDDYYSLYTFFFSNNATHAEAFNNGSQEKMEKSTLFDNVSKYIGQYLLNMSVDNLDVSIKVLTDQKSKDAFMEVMRDKSH